MAHYMTLADLFGEPLVVARPAPSASIDAPSRPPPVPPAPAPRPSSPRPSQLAALACAAARGLSARDEPSGTEDGDESEEDDLLVPKPKRPRADGDPPPPRLADLTAAADADPLLELDTDLIVADELSEVVGDDDDDYGSDGGGGSSGASYPRICAPTVAAREELDLGAGPNGGAPGRVPAHINAYLREYQKEGVRFLWRAYAEERGCILADEMGLGKTIQTLVFLIALFGKTATAAGDEPAAAARPSAPLGGAPAPAARATLALVVCPSSVMEQWQRELTTWCPFKVLIAHGKNKAAALDAARERRCEVLIGSYDLLTREAAALGAIAPTVAIFDEAHRLKNAKSACALGAHALRTRVKLLLTGTPMSNGFSELWALLDLASAERVGPYKVWHNVYAKPVMNGLRKGASDRQLLARAGAVDGLQALLDKWMLLRRKAVIAAQLPKKEDNIVFCELGAEQAAVYARVLRSADFAALRNYERPCTCGSGLALKLCCQMAKRGGPLWRHMHADGEVCAKCPSCLCLPALTHALKLANHLDLVRANRKDPPDTYARDAAFAQMAFGVTDDDGVAVGVGGGRGAPAGQPACAVWEQSDRCVEMASDAGCGKLRALRLLLAEWRRDVPAANRVLLFSYSVRMLDILALALASAGYPFCRLDGATPVAARAKLVSDFNAAGSAKYVFLISTKAGGLGLNLVSANKVVIFDANWNPSHDLQAQDRAFRIGQRRDVDVYRLVSAGTVEERIYLRQVYKQGVAAVALERSAERRHFDGVQGDRAQQGELFGLANLFALQLPDSSLTRQLLGRTDGGQADAAGGGGGGASAALCRKPTTTGLLIAAVRGGAARAAPADDDDDGTKGASDLQAADGAACDELALSNLVTELEAEDSARQTKLRRAQALQGAGALYVHDHAHVVGQSQSEGQRIDRLRQQCGAPPQPPPPWSAVPTAGAAAAAAVAPKPEAEPHAARAAAAAPPPVAPPPPRDARGRACALVDVAYSGASRLGKTRFLDLVKSELKLAQTLRDLLEPDELAALAELINANSERGA